VHGGTLHGSVGAADAFESTRQEPGHGPT
jgi:hypothetical protein